MTLISSIKEFNLELEKLEQQVNQIHRYFVDSHPSALECAQTRIYREAAGQYIDQLRHQLTFHSSDDLGSVTDTCDNFRKELVQLYQQLGRLSATWHQLETIGITQVRQSAPLFVEIDEWLRVSRPSEQPLKCNILDVTVVTGRQLLSKSAAVRHQLVNLAEDQLGTVRTYIRIKPATKPSLLSVEGLSVVVQPTGAQYGPFYGVFPGGWLNEDIYLGQQLLRICDESPDTTTPGICRVAQQLADGYHMILFASGASGAGKTTTLFGDSNQPGLAELCCREMQAAGYQSRVTHIFELAMGKVDFLQQSANSGLIIDLYHTHYSSLEPLIASTSIRREILEAGSIITEIAKTGINMDNIAEDDLSRLRQVLDHHRSRRGRIVATPNNPQSSRSHLFILLDFYRRDKPDVAAGRLTIFDSAGLESPIQILQSFWHKPDTTSWNLQSLFLPGAKPGANITPQKFTLKTTSKTVGHEVTRSEEYVGALNRIAQDPKSVVDIIKQGVYINFSLTDMRYFFNRRVVLPSSPKPKLAVLKFPVREDTYSPQKALRRAADLEENDTVGMYTVLRLLSELRSPATQTEMPTKFVLLACVQDEASDPQKAQGTLDMLQFAQSIRST